MKSKKSIAWIVIIIMLTTIIIVLTFGWKIYNTQINSISDEFEFEAERIEQSFEDTVNHTAYIMRIMARQIIINYPDKEYINNILGKYKVNQNVANLLSWTSFSWSNQSNKITVNGLYGILDKSDNVSHRTNIISSKMHPGQLFLGNITVGNYSNRMIIPASIGIVNNHNEYIGAMNVGFDVQSLAAKLSQNKAPNVDFAVLEQDTHNIIIKSPHLTNSVCGQHSTIPVEAKINQVIQSLNSSKLSDQYTSKLDLLNNEDNYYVYKLRNLPYLLYLHYNPESIDNQFWEDITSRTIEISVISLVSISLIIAIARHESKLRQLAEEAKEEALQASKYKSDFLAFSAHEIKTPLSYIIMSSEMMMQEILGTIPQEYYDYISNIHQAGLDLVTFLDDLLDRAQIERGSFKIDNRVVDITEIIYKVVEQNHIKAKQANISIVMHLAPNIPFIYADARRIVQILNNLLSNSIKYSTENTTVTIKVFVQDNHMHLVVEDQGFGIKQSDIKIAFSEYGTIHNKNSEKVKSIGLGLPLVEYLVKAHDAKLVVESIIDKGTKISIIFGPERLRYDSESST